MNPGSDEGLGSPDLAILEHLHGWLAVPRVRLVKVLPLGAVHGSGVPRGHHESVALVRRAPDPLADVLLGLDGDDRVAHDLPRRRGEVSEKLRVVREADASRAAPAVEVERVAVLARAS